MHVNSLHKKKKTSKIQEAGAKSRVLALPPLPECASAAQLLICPMLEMASAYSGIYSGIQQEQTSDFITVAAVTALCETQTARQSRADGTRSRKGVP